MFSIHFCALLLFSLTSASNNVPFISHGQNAEITEFPYLISVQEINVHVCVASLLNEKWALSVARCLFTRKISELNIEFGVSEIIPNGTSKARVSRIIFHEDFSVSPLTNDISLIESEIPIITGFHQPFAKLIVPGGSRFRQGTAAVHAGWGNVRQNVRTSTLQKADLTTMQNEECETFRRSRSQICATGQSAICQADPGKISKPLQMQSLIIFYSGSPLLVSGILVGVASFKDGPACDTAIDIPNVYTDVSYFVDWVEEKTGIDYQLNMFLQGKP